MPEISAVLIWLIIAIILGTIEAITVSLVSIWFAVGALAALLAAMFDAPVWLQLVWFFAISIAAFAVTRPLAKKYLNSKTQPTNADMLIGQECIVTEPIDNVAGTGAVSVGGKVWTARTTDDHVIPQGSHATVLRIEGVKLIVNPVRETADAEA